MAEVQPQTEAGEMTQIFVEFVMMQAQNAALFLGQIPNPQGGQTEVNLPLAKMFIDQLAVIRAKTRGNLNRDEQRVIDSAVGQLEAAFVEMAGGIGPEGAGMTPGGLFAPPAPAPQSPQSPPPSPPPEASSPVPPAPAPPAPPEEGRKKFTKSYGA
jgi:Domain of unknown function (DUF1844)